MVAAIAVALLLGLAARPVRLGAQSGQGDWDAALAAELVRTPGGIVIGSADTCPVAAACVVPEYDSSDAAYGVAAFGVASPGTGGYLDVLGRAPDGSWQWFFTTQQGVYHLLRLPGAMFVCAGGDSLNVHTAPSRDAPLVGVLLDRAPVTAEEFSLTDPGFFGPGGREGQGWYRLSAPYAGWASSLYLSDAAQPDCSLHDALTAGA